MDSRYSMRDIMMVKNAVALARKNHDFASGPQRYSRLRRSSATERILVVFTKEAKAL
jgi:hypothetical protein